MKELQYWKYIRIRMLIKKYYSKSRKLLECKIGQIRQQVAKLISCNGLEPPPSKWNLLGFFQFPKSDKLVWNCCFSNVLFQPNRVNPVRFVPGLAPCRNIPPLGNYHFASHNRLLNS